MNEGYTHTWDAYWEAQWHIDSLYEELQKVNRDE